MANILLVEDHPLVRRLCREQLEALGHVVIAVENAEAAQETFSRNPDFDLLMSDWSLPGEMDGLQLANWLRNHDPRIPVLLVSGFAAAERVGEDARFPVLLKPFTSDELNQHVEDLLSGSSSGSRRSAH